MKKLIKKGTIYIKTIVITGANGFVGSALCEQFNEKKVNVYAIVRNKMSDVSRIESLEYVKIIYCDLSEIKSLLFKIKSNCDLFYHLAWEGAGGDLRSNYEVQLSNVKYSCDCIDVAKELNCKKILFSGTVSENIIDDVLESTVAQTNFIYGICKKTTLNLIHVLCKQKDLPYVWMRLANVYGENSNNGNIVEYTLKNFSENKVPDFSSGNQIYDMIYIKDLTKAMYLLGKSNLKNNIYYIGSGNPMKLKEYLLKMAEIYGNGARVNLGVRKDDGINYKKDWYSILELTEHTGYVSDYSFTKGLIETLKSLKEEI